MLLGGGAALNITAIDKIFENLQPKINFPNIKLSTNLEQIPANSLFFMSDVLHHINENFRDEIFNKISHENVRAVVIKDIDATHKFGNFANKMHDLIINGEKVVDVWPQNLQDKLKSFGFECKYFYIPKLWYSHFLITAKRA